MAFGVVFPNAEPQVGKPSLPGLLDSEVEKLPAETLAVMAGENMELFDLETVSAFKAASAAALSTAGCSNRYLIDHPVRSTMWMAARR
jgi:hypothetical protein